MGRTVGYMRVSTTAQNEDRQKVALIGYGVKSEDIYLDKMTGAKFSRPSFDRMKADLQEGDTLVCESISRIGRSLGDLLQFLEFLQSKGVAFVSLKEDIDISSSSGKLVFAIISALAQYEREMIHTRCEEGRRLALERGVKFGRKPVDRTLIDKAIKLYSSGQFTVAEITNMTGIKRSTLYNYVSKLRA